MPGLHKVVRHLNRQFDDDNIHSFTQYVAEFAPGKPLNVEVLQFPDRAVARRFQAYLDALPSGLKETLRGLFSHALSATPPIPISFSWVPAYDYELTVWQPLCGILVQFRSPTPHEGGQAG